VELIVDGGHFDWSASDKVSGLQNLLMDTMKRECGNVWPQSALRRAPYGRHTRLRTLHEPIQCLAVPLGLEAVAIRARGMLRIHWRLQWLEKQPCVVWVNIQVFHRT